MDKLDLLAKVLGVTVTSEVSQVKRPSTKGRPRKKKDGEMGHTFKRIEQANARELRMLVKELKTLGIRTIARGQFGDSLENSEELYTQTLVLDCGEDRVQDVVNVVNDIGSQVSWDAYHPSTLPNKRGKKGAQVSATTKASERND